MAHFLIEYVQTGDTEAREQYRAEHIAYRKSWGSALALAGPLLGDGAEPVGSLVILESKDAASARELAVQDPYVKNRVFELDSIRPMRIAFVKSPQ